MPGPAAEGAGRLAAHQPEQPVDPLVGEVLDVAGVRVERAADLVVPHRRADAQARVEPAAGEHVDGRPVLGEPERVLPAERGDGRAELDPAGALRRRREHRDRRGDAVLQVPVPQPGAVEAQLLAELDDPQRRLVPGARVVGVEQADRQESQPAQHRALLPRAASVVCCGLNRLPRRFIPATVAGMRLLVLGGSVFLSRAVAADAVRRGHDVTCANRGTSGSVPDGARLVVWDRTEPVPAELADELRRGRRRRPLPVVDAVGRGGFPQRPLGLRLHRQRLPGPVTRRRDARQRCRCASPLHEDVDLAVEPGGLRPDEGGVRADRAARAPPRATVIRPGPDRRARRPERPVHLLAGAAGRRRAGAGRRRPGDSPQVIDVRDLAAWIVSCAEARLVRRLRRRRRGATMATILDQVAAGVGADAGPDLGAATSS